MRTALLLALSLAAASASPARAATAGVSVGKGQSAGVVHVEGSLKVAASSATAWAVLTDYDHLSQFVSSMRSSRAERGPKGLRVEQVAVGRYGVFHSAMRVVLAITEVARSEIDFEDTSECHCFKVYRGSWRLEPSAQGTFITYRLDAEPSGAAARLVAKGAMRKNVERLLLEVGQEIERRQAHRA